MSDTITHHGGCHCGAVRYEVDAPADLEVTECNCSICSKSGSLHLIVNSDRFRLLKGEDNLITYTFDTHEAKHYFCKNCGIKSFYIPRSHPEGFSVNARCLDEGTVQSMTISQFDGKNWEKNIEALRKKRGF
ncbi:MAG: GFA family protein [Gammaproteobacteria bacterium]|nr:GFA family protein [Gammaproteobacteria bacterium]